ITTQDFKQAGDFVYVIGQTYNDFNGSEIQKMQTGKVSGQLFDFDLDNELKMQNLVTQAIQNDLLNSAHDVSEGGLIVAIAEATFKNQLGVNLTSELTVRQFFAETQCRFVVSVSPENKVAFEQLVGDDATR